MKVLFLQTADKTYSRLLDLSAQTVKEYCNRHDHVYESYLGIVRGYYPWHAVYNRIPLLKRIMDGGWTGWVCYLDADSYIADLNFDLRDYLADKSELAFIAASDRPGDPGRPYWLVNSGVFLINLAHPFARTLATHWDAEFAKLTDERLQGATVWGGTTLSDQGLLQPALRDLPGAEAAMLTLRGKQMVLNYLGGRFIRQILRVDGTMEQRIGILQAEVSRIVLLSAPEDTTAAAFLAALFRVLLLREPDPDGLASWIKEMRSGIGFEESLRGFLRSPEFRGKLNIFVKTYVDTKPAAST